MSRLSGSVFLLCVFLLGATVVLPAGAWAQAGTFTFTAIPDQDATRLEARFDKVARYLARELDVDVEYVPVTSYAAAVTAFRNDQVQLAWFGGLSGVRARAFVPGSTAIAQGKEDRAFRTYFIAHESTGLEETEGFPEGVAGMTFAFGAKGSTSGRLMPEFYIRRFFGRAPDDVFSRVGFSGDHSRTISLVQSGAYQLGAVNFQVWRREMAEGKIDPERVHVIWRTPPYPDYHWTIRAGVNTHFGDGFADRVKAALLSMNDRPDLLSSFPRSAFVPAANADYTPIRRTAEAIDLID